MRHWNTGNMPTNEFDAGPVAPPVLNSECLITCCYSPILGHTAYMAAFSVVLGPRRHDAPTPPPFRRNTCHPNLTFAPQRGTRFVEVYLDGTDSDCNQRH